MSAYREIKTEFRNIESFRKALEDLKVPFETAPDPRQPTMNLFDWHGQQRPEQASFAIRRREVNKNWSMGASNDLGFAWDGKQINVILSQYDSSIKATLAALDKLKQRYAYHEVMHLARAQGWSVGESATVGGTINVTIRKYGG